MKLYDYIFHPDPKANGEWSVQGMDLENEDVERQQGPLICMSIEELREVWAMAKAGPDYPGVFELFLKSKGIITN